MLVEIRTLKAEALKHNSVSAAQQTYYVILPQGEMEALRNEQPPSLAVTGTYFKSAAEAVSAFHNNRDYQHEDYYQKLDIHNPLGGVAAHLRIYQFTIEPSSLRQHTQSPGLSWDPQSSHQPHSVSCNVVLNASADLQQQARRTARVRS